MSAYWPLPPTPSARFEIPLAQVTALLQKLGLSGRHAVAEDLLRLVGAHVPLAQCTIFSYEGQGRPRIVAVGDRARTQALPRISQDYVARFYPLDGSQQVMQAELAAAQKAPPSHPHILLHRQKGEDIAHREYREICYELPQVAERLAILALYEGQRWLSVNFYRGLEHGPFDDAAIAAVEAFAPLVVQAVRLHYAGHVVHNELAELLLARLLRRCPELTKRDVDLVRGLLAGLATEGIADRMGIEVSSAQTYLKRVYRKLGISGQRELLGLLLASEAGAP
ncbi:helix-turn-helix transcriptional regulator [Ramlibacter sp. 2FC]|uniref:helix-turn-helix transcriptional regulator n=1 Tax=Ramlibacter sp. 2FC TaxID=2502188 RepID=UPI0010F706D0|nr:helix-turn-helix transcriptional regulator [Ramlibacter sp. 2FC]